MIDRPINLTTLNSLVAFWIQNGGSQHASDANWLRAHAWRVTIFWGGFWKCFSGFHVDFWIANYFLIRKQFICGSNNLIRICNSFFRFDKLSNKDLQKNIEIWNSFSDLEIIFGLPLFGFRSQKMLWRNFCKFLSFLPLLEKQSIWFSPTTLPHQVWLPSHCRQIPAPCSQTRRSRHHYAKRNKKPNNCKVYSKRFQLSK